MNRRDKEVIEHWLRLYDRLIGTTFKVEDWPDKDSSKKNIDAICRDLDGHTLGIEHTLIEPFEGEKADAPRFLRTLGTLENHPRLIQKGYMVLASQQVASIPTGINWDDVSRELLKQLSTRLPTLSDGDHSVTIKSEQCTLNLKITKLQMGPDYSGTFLTGRIYPGEPEPVFIVNALKEKIPKLSASLTEKRLLLLEQDAVAGTTESKLERVREDPEIRSLMDGIDEIWSVRTAGLAKESVIFTNQIMPRNDSTHCSLNVITDAFWKVNR